MTSSSSHSVDDSTTSPEPAAQEAGATSSVIAPATAPTQSFADFGVNEDIVQSLRDHEIHSPFPIQAMTLPVALRGRDIIGQAKTGTGKTLGFGIPMLHSIMNDTASADSTPTAPRGLVVLPTRELAIQVAADLTTASSRRPQRILTVYGGRAYEPQIEALREGVDIVVGTPGRIIDLLRQRHLDLSHVQIAVLDEADEMLDLGFLEDIEKILQSVPSTRQTMLFSATMPGPILALARRFMNQPTHIRAHDPGDESRTKADIAQVVYRVHQLDKIEVMARILQARERGLTIVFMRTKRQADRLAEDLLARGFAVAALHGDLGQGAREQALRAFRNGKVDVLVATDVAARGIDVDDVTHVVNWNCPDDDKTFLHRTGRTGRAGKKGTAVTFVDWEDVARWSLIARQLGLDSTEATETYSTSENLYRDLNIPEDATGILPEASRTRAGLDAEKAENLDGSRSRGRSGSGRQRSGGRDQRSRSRQRSKGGNREASHDDSGAHNSDAPGRGAKKARENGNDSAQGNASGGAQGRNASTRRRRNRRRTKHVAEQPGTNTNGTQRRDGSAGGDSGSRDSRS